MKKIKSFEQFSVFIAIAVVYVAFFAKSIPIAIVILLFGILVQIYLYWLYKKENKAKEFLRNKLSTVGVGMLLLVFFWVKNNMF